MLKQSLVIAIAILMLTAASGFGQSDTTKKSPKAGTHPSTSGPTKVTGNPKRMLSGLEYWDIQVGTGATASTGQKVQVHYTGWLLGGRKFDSSMNPSRPFSFTPSTPKVLNGCN